MFLTSEENRTLNKRLHDQLEGFSLGDSEDDDEIYESIQINGKEDQSEIGLKLNQGVIKVTNDADHLCINSTKELLFISGIDSKYNMINGINVRETEENVLALDMEIDTEDCLWIHNSLNGKLMKFNKNLVKIKEFDGCETILPGKKNGVILKALQTLLACYVLMN